MWSPDLASAAADSVDSCVYKISLPKYISDDRWVIQMTSITEIDTLLNDTIADWYTYGEYYDYFGKTCLKPEICIVCEIYKMVSKIHSF